MSKKPITFRLIAYSAAAGKYDPDAPREGNEDNFYIDDDLSDDQPGNCYPDEIITMSDCGCLMVVADGMGGMNAGEVASEIAIKTVEDYFASGRVTPKIANSKAERKCYLEQVIKEADRNVKLDAKNNPEHEGMGSTIILAWIVGGHVTISWCGDSRAYRFNPVNGIEPLSRDHSYVQELVNRGDIPYEATFDHPQNNIVTRSLGDPNNAAKPETRDFEVYNGDIILVCSDGLSGVLRDKKTLVPDNSGNYYPGENIEDIIRGHQDSMIECKDALMNAAQKADWYDNVTVLLCQILSGATPPIRKTKTMEFEKNEGSSRSNKSKKVLAYLAIAVLFILFGCICYFFGMKNATRNIKDYHQEETSTSEETESTTGSGKSSAAAQEKEIDEWAKKSLGTIDQYKEILAEQVNYFNFDINNVKIGDSQQAFENINDCNALVEQIIKRAKYISELKDIENNVRDTEKYKEFIDLLTSPLSLPYGLISEEQFNEIRLFIDRAKELSRADPI